MGDAIGEAVKISHPKPEIVGPYRIVYPIWRDDLAEATLIPIPEPSKQMTLAERYGTIEIK